MYKFYFRRYAPFKTFGIPRFKGDNRDDATLNDDDTYKTCGVVAFNASEALNLETSSSGTEMPFFGGTLRRVSTVSGLFERQPTAAGVVSFAASTSGANPLMPGAPPIDTYVSVAYTMRSNSLEIHGAVNGDPFPNCEAFVRGPLGTKVLLFHYETSGNRNTGPFSLFGSNRANVLGRFEFTLSLGQAGALSGVIRNGRYRYRQGESSEDHAPQLPRIKFAVQRGSGR